MSQQSDNTEKLEEFSVNKDISSLTLYLGLRVYVYVTLYELLWMMEHLVVVYVDDSDVKVNREIPYHAKYWNG